MASDSPIHPTNLAEIKSVLSQCMLRDRFRIERRLADISTVPDGRRSWLAGKLLHAVSESHSIWKARKLNLPALTYPPSLPITGKKDDIVSAIRNHQVVVVAGETGSGKTTQIPKMCLEAGLGIAGKIGCTQPRRVAALSVSQRVAEELRRPWGKEVGCKIRFSDQSSPETYIKFMTDGILLAETQRDPWLGEYEAIVIDEAHERSLNIDFLLGYLNLLLRKRPDLKLIITSATIDTETFSRAFGNAPIIEVSGRLFPVEVIYSPIDQNGEESGDLTYIDAACNAVETALIESNSGDILIFMPGERDIREARDLLQGRYASDAEIIPLFGRLTSGEQQRVFAPSARRKIIIATNIAETSLTIPGIRYVIDSGLARISRYNPRTRTKRLPIEPIAQSSANQRMGRSGRVENGICIRLYSEDDFNERPRFTQPEIQRANLAEVILRMKAFRLGEIESFPFIQPPQAQAIRAGYTLLQELGALDAENNLTSLGNDLAKLPVDPTIGRMIIESVKERVVDEVMVIAAALSIQDPRERPIDQREAADAAHRRFLNPDSDFLTLLNIWNAYHDQWEALPTQNQMRKFCKSHFVSFTRMREWRDVHAQLVDVAKELKSVEARPNLDSASNRSARNETGIRAPELSLTLGKDEKAAAQARARYFGIHRSILAGLLGHVAQQAEGNAYRASGGRQVQIFPGSALFAKPASKPGKRPVDPKKEPPKPVAQAAWIVAGEIMETSRLFARTVARIDPRWIEELGSHLCKYTYDEPRWNAKAGRVLVTERVLLHGLEVTTRRVGYSNINPQHATEIFIRSALVEDDLPVTYKFLDHNRQVREKIETWQTRLRHADLPDLDRAFYEYYSTHIENVSSIHDLNRFLRDHVAANPDFLCASEAELIGDRELKIDSGAFPDYVQFCDRSVALQYAYAPGEDHDGVTLHLTVDQVQDVDPGAVPWVVPGLRDELITELLRSLPKSIRRDLMPLPDKVQKIVAAWHPSESGFLESLSKFIHTRFGIVVPVSAWQMESLPKHLRPRVAVLDKNKKVLSASRDVASLRNAIKNHETPADTSAWSKAVLQWERYGITAWTLGDVPEKILVSDASGVALHAFPGLVNEDGDVHLKLFRSRKEAGQASRTGFQRLGEIALQKELAWLQKDLRVLDKVKDLYVTLGPGDELLESAYTNVRAHVFHTPADPVLSEDRFRSFLEEARARSRAIFPRFIDWVGAILRSRQELLLARNPYPGLKQDLDALVPKQFLRAIPFEQLQQIPRYLKAMSIRSQRAALNPVKDRERFALVKPYVDRLSQLRAAAPKPSSETAQALAELRWMIEEFKVSIFAQELGTAFPVSAKRIDQFIAAQLSVV